MLDLLMLALALASFALFARYLSPASGAEP